MIGIGQDSKCISVDCYNGFGTYIYTGEWDGPGDLCTSAIACLKFLLSLLRKATTSSLACCLSSNFINSKLGMLIVSDRNKRFLL